MDETEFLNEVQNLRNAVKTLQNRLQNEPVSGFSVRQLVRWVKKLEEASLALNRYSEPQESTTVKYK